MPHSFPTDGHLRKLWGGRPRPRPAPGRPTSLLQTLDPSKEQRDEASRADQGSAPLDIRKIPGLGKLCGVTSAPFAIRPRVVALRWGATRPASACGCAQPIRTQPARTTESASAPDP